MSDPHQKSDTGRQIMETFAAYLLKRIVAANMEAGDALPAAELSVIRQFLSDQSITLAHVRRGDFGDVARAAADDFPFSEDGTPKGGPMMGAVQKAN